MSTNADTEACPRCDADTTFGRYKTVELSQAPDEDGDPTEFYVCPACDWAWHGYTERDDSYSRQQVQPYVDQHNRQAFGASQL